MVSLVVGDGGWVRDGPDLVVPFGDDHELSSVGNMLFVGTLLVSVGGALRIAHPAFQRFGLIRLTGVGNERENERRQQQSQDLSLHLSSISATGIEFWSEGLRCVALELSKERENWSQGIQSRHPSPW